MVRSVFSTRTTLRSQKILSNLDSGSYTASRTQRTNSGDASHYFRYQVFRAGPILAFITSRAERRISAHFRPDIRCSAIDSAGARPAALLPEPGTFPRLEIGLPDAGLSGQPPFSRTSADRAYL